MDRRPDQPVESERSLLDDVPAIVWELRTGSDGDDLRVTFVSRFAETLLGYSLDQWTGDPEFWLKLVHPDDRERVMRTIHEMPAESAHTSQYRVIARGGQTLWLETKCSIIRRPNGSIEGLRNVSMDITERKRAQTALRQRAAKLAHLARELKEKNDELDQFAYVTSHDLRAPLRGIANLSSWIEEDMGDRFTPEGHQQMELLRGRVNRMEALIDGILQYARVGRVAVSIEAVDVGKLLRETIDLLAPPQSTRIELLSSMPLVRTEKLSLQQVFINLIGNAIKHNPRSDRHIEISCRDVGAFYSFAVSDNGPGIAPKYHEKIFVMFQTLEARDKVEGAGVGLPLVRKIVEHHGGQVSVESREREGSIFRFTWPKEPANDTRHEYGSPAERSPGRR
jgi:PAS domain S-box-containing protein